MSALADALVAAQRRALAATEKAYVAGAIEYDDAVAEMGAFGLTDRVDIDFLLAALDVIRLRGAALPVEPANGKPDERATQAQWILIGKLASERSLTPPDGPLTKAQAHEIIDALKAGTYDAAKWSVPF